MKRRYFTKFLSKHKLKLLALVTVIFLILAVYSVSAGFLAPYRAYFVGFLNGANVILLIDLLIDD